LPSSSADPASPFVVDFLQALRRAGVEPAVITAKIGGTEPRFEFPVYRFDWGESEKTLSELNLLRPASWTKINNYFSAGCDCVLEHLGNHEYDHILALWALPSGWFAYQAAQHFDTEYSIWSLGSDINIWAKRPLAGRMIRRALRGASHLFADGDELAEKVTRICGHECHFLPSFHRFDEAILPAGREQFFLYLGRLEKSKGIYDLLKAFAAIKRDIWEYRLIFIGTGSEEKKLRAKAKSLGLRGKVHVLGWLPQDEVLNFLQRARALVIPTHCDSIPLVFGEALQTATPLVVTDVGDLGTLVRDNKLGFVARRKSVSSLHDALVKMIVSEIKIARAAQRLMEHLSPERAVEKFLEVTGGL
jgi:glycosyltransferase involved in cell wall biosynthesis